MRAVMEETLRRTCPGSVPILPSTLDNLAVVRGATATAVRSPRRFCSIA
jgi:hypothetical protein